MPRAAQPPPLKLKHAGLSALARAVVGERVDKALQCSAWHERPLTREMLECVAALLARARASLASARRARILG